MGFRHNSHFRNKVQEEKGKLKSSSPLAKVKAYDRKCCNTCNDEPAKCSNNSFIDFVRKFINSSKNIKGEETNPLLNSNSDSDSEL